MIWLVLWGQAFDRIGDSASYETQSVIPASRRLLIGKTETVQCLKQQNSGLITGKWATSAVCTVHPGRQADNQQLCMGITKWRHRLCMIIRVIALDLIKIARKPRTISAFHAESGI